MISPAEELWDIVLCARARVEPALEKSMSAAGGLSLAAFYALRHLATVDAAVNVTDIAAATAFSRTRMSRVIDGLVQEGLVQRQHDPGNDARNRPAVITAAGAQLLELAAAAHRDSIENEIGSWVSGADVQQVLQLLRGDPGKI